MKTQKKVREVSEIINSLVQMHSTVMFRKDHHEDRFKNSPSQKCFIGKGLIESVVLTDCFDYKVNRYILSEWTKELVIDYTGTLTGKTGSCPYVKESINEDYTLIRWESYVYPLFYDDVNVKLSEYIKRDQRQDSICVQLPSKYDVRSFESIESHELSGSEQLITLVGCANNFTLAISTFSYLPLSSGDFYLLKDKGMEHSIEEKLLATHQFMNQTFGVREISSSTQYIEIPSGLGSYVQGKSVFLDSNALISNSNGIRQIVHEFIHLGWNPKVKEEVQKCRFFDEALTNYFTLRVMDNLLNANDYKLVFNSYIESYNRQRKRLNKDIAIVDFGVHGYGDLSYTIGSLAIHELEEFVGREAFDTVMTNFLEDYRNTETDFDSFKQYFTNHVNVGLDDYFESWIFGHKGMSKYQF